MKDKLPGVGSLNINKGSAWPAITGGIVGGLIGLAILSFHSYVFVRINTVIIGAALGASYVRVWKKERNILGAGAYVGGIFGLHPISLCVFAIGAPIFLASLWLLYEEDELDLLTMCIVGALLCALGGYLGWRLTPHIKYWLYRPYFVVPLLSFAGYFIGCKISEPKKPKELAKGGLSMKEEKIPIPEILNEKEIKKDLIFHKDKGEKSLNSYLSHLVERFRTDQEIKTLKKWTEQLNMRTEFITASTGVKRAQAEFRRVDTEGKTEAEKLITVQLEEQYKRKELQKSLEDLDLEHEYKRLELQKKIDELKKPPRPRESESERIKRQESERAIKIMERIKGITERAEFLSNWKKKMKKEHPEEAEEIIDEVDRTMVEEGLKEE